MDRTTYHSRSGYIRRFRLLLCVFSAIYTLTLPIFADTALSVTESAAKEETVQSSIAFVKAAIPAADTSADKRSMYALLGSLQESLALYDDAQKSYAAACAISASDAEGVPRVSNEMLVLDAVRCALCAGDSGAARRYLSSIADSQDKEVQSWAALYTQWCAISDASSVEQTKAPLTRLKSYSTDDAYIAVRPQILLTLWYVGGDNAAGQALLKEWPQSVEAAIVSGKVHMLPVPFWYFVPRTDADTSTAAKAPPVASQPDTGEHSERDEAIRLSGRSADTDAEDENDNRTRPRLIQLGLFRERANAEHLASSLTSKGFQPVITTETRASGTTYYIVVIEHPTVNIEASLRTAGYEFYPVF